MPTVIKETTKKMVVNLSVEECDRIGEELANKKLEYERLEAEKSETLKDFNAKLTTLDKEMHVLAVARTEHKAEREVAVKEIYDDEREMVEVRDMDTDELVESRDYTQAEKGAKFTRAQPGLFDGTVDPDKKVLDDIARAPKATEEDETDVGAPADPAELAGPTGDEKANAPRRRVPKDLPPEEDAP